jgi:hypothetical protein
VNDGVSTQFPDEEDYMAALIGYLEQESLIVLDELRDVKTGRLSLAIRSIASAVILLGLDEILTISIPVLQKLEVLYSK